MRPIGAGLAVVLMLAGFWPSAAFAPAAAAAKAALPGITKDQRDKGMAAAPGLITAAGLDCTLADARLIGQNKDPKTKTTSSYYELACTGNEGAVVATLGDAPPQVFTCAETAAPGRDGKPSTLMCVLPGNLDPKAGLIPYIAKAGVPCTPDQVRALGHSPTATVYELKCHEGAGYILEVSAPPRRDKPVTMNPCIAYGPGLNIQCELTDRAAQMAMVDRLAAQSGNPCTVTDRRFIGTAQSGMMFYEVSCQGGKGYVLETTANGTFKQAVDCAAADALGGGCKLTDARQAKTEQAGLYTQLARKAGFQCQVSGYAPFSVNIPGKEVVELACSNRPDGGIGVFATAASGASIVYDCAHSELENFRCGLTKPQAAYPALTADLKSLGKTSCAVSNSRVVGVSADQKGYIEVACADGLPGFMIQYSISPMAARSAIVCAEAKGIGGGCTLPGNVKKS
ncbi:MAG TPA: hypothetical protein VII63_06805 [Caulobacteraceae bacterium]